MAPLASLLPPHLVRFLGAHPSPRLPAATSFPAGLLFSDISGFTALTERLQSRGRSGAEEVAEAVGAAFAPAIDSIARRHGSIVSFGGDAVFALFPGPAAVSRAQAAAVEIRDAFARRREAPGVPALGVAQAIHFGRVKGVHLGTPARRHHVVTGAAVRALARLESSAVAGQILLSRRAAASLASEPRAWAAPRAVPRAAPGILGAYVEPSLRPLAAGFDGEFRRVAVLFLETRGGSVRALQTFHARLIESLDAAGGTLLKTDLSSHGLKWLCVFGVPDAHEDDPDRGARAGLDALRGTPRALTVRGGLHDGVVANVIVGTLRRRTIDVMGDVVNTAARALGQAAWGELWVTEATRRRLSGSRTEARGERAVKGKAEALALHAVLGPQGATRAVGVQGPLVGRERELGLLVEGLRSAAAGKGLAIAITGEAGIGKSRLAHEAAQAARGMGLAAHVGRSVGFGGLAYWAIGELLRSVLALPADAPAHAVLEATRGAARRLQLRPSQGDHLALVLGVRRTGSAISHLSPRDQRLNAMLAITAFLGGVSREAPMLLVLEDMHWADEATREAAAWLARGAATSASVLLLLSRPGHEPPAQATRMALGPLSSADAGQLVATRLGDAPASVRALVLERSAGNPLFIEELVRHVTEIGPASGEPGELPATLESLAGARLDRLPRGARLVSQHAAVIGTTFRRRLLAHLPGLCSMVAPALSELGRRRLIVAGARKPHVEHSWSHALVRDVAYQRILTTRRRELHRAVADGIEALFRNEREALLPILGHHQEQAGDLAAARRCYLEAARRARDLHALDEAARLYRSYLSLVETPSVESVRARQQLGGDVLVPRGLAREARKELELARRDAHGLRHRSLEAESLRLLAVSCRAGGDFPEARRLAARSVALARSAGDPGVLGRALGSQAGIDRLRGRLAAARRKHEMALALHRKARLESDASRDLGNLAGVLHQQGEIDEALRRYERALEAHRRRHRLGSIALVLGNRAVLLQELGRTGDARRDFERCLAIERRIGHRQGEGRTLARLGVVAYGEGLLEEAAALSREALLIHDETGDRIYAALTRGNLGNALLKIGRVEEAGALQEEALTIASSSGSSRILAFLLGNAAWQRGFATGDAGAMDVMAARTARCAAAAGDQAEIARSCCLRGHAALGRGRVGRAQLLLRNARRKARSLRAGAASSVGQAIAMLARAVAAAASARPLVCGHHPADLTEAQLRWLRDHRPSALPPEVAARLSRTSDP